jgi:hypothetical protein
VRWLYFNSNEWVFQAQSLESQGLAEPGPNPNHSFESQNTAENDEYLTFPIQ